MSLYVIPGSKQDGFAKFKEGIPVLRIRERPIDGAANQALLKCLSSLLSMRTSAIKLLSGATNRRKVVKIQGDPAEIKKKLLTILAEKQ